MKNTDKTSGQRIIVFGNPRAGARSRQETIDAFVSQLESRKYQIEKVTDPAVLSDLVATRLKEGDLRLVVSAGGDGTVRLVVNLTPAETPIMPLPMGTENLLAKYLRIPKEPDQWPEIVDSGSLVRWDTGRVIEGDQSRIFLLMLGCGFDADVVRRLDESRSGHIWHLSYMKPILDSMRNYEYPELQIEYRSNESELWTSCTSHWAFAFNVPTYAGGLRIAPVADPTDGMLDLCTFTGASLPQSLFQLAAVLLRQQGEWSGFSHVGSPRIRISSEQKVPYQIDGDTGGYLPVELEVNSRRVTLVTPPSFRSVVATS